MKTSHQISFQVKSDLVYLEEVLSRFEGLKKNWITSKIWLQCQLALAEGFTNAVRHAHCDQPVDTPIEIEIFLNDQEILIKIWDNGEPFLLETAHQEKKEEKKDNLATGGRGINIMQKIADELRYDRLDDDRNCLIIRKKIIVENMNN